MSQGNQKEADRFDIVYREIQPEPALDWLVWHFWEMEVREIPGPAFSHRIVPDACLSVVVLPGKRLIALGPRTEAIEVPVHQGDFFAGIRFRPGSAQSVFGLDVKRCLRFVGPFEQVSTTLSSALVRSLGSATDTSSYIARLSSALTAMPVGQGGLHPTVSAAIMQIEAASGDLDILGLAGMLNTTPRHLQRLFKSRIGLSPKQVVRLQRFRSSAANLVSKTPLPWAEVAAERGFSDQAHLIRDFTDLGGGSPGLLAEQIGKIRHEGVSNGS